jgi:uncharacterized protein YbgA (DUF1722 family)/uncharacterized protein YbbK (DUF523 family)
MKALPRPEPAWRSPSLQIRIGISSCLLGEEVRYDGGHQRDSYITGTLGRYFSFVPVCPEMEIGLGAPRETLRLVGAPDGPRMVGTASGADHTERMNAFARARVQTLAGAGLSGYIFKRASPSCGMERVKVYGASGAPTPSGTGLFARVLLDELPLLPAEEEGRLGDPHLRDNFITRVFTHRRLQALAESRPGAAEIVEFHTAHKYLLLAHSPSHYARLGRLVARVADAPVADGLARYREGVMQALRVKATRPKHVNVLQHLAGFFKRQLGAAERRELATLIGDYGRGLVPLVVPITMINHHLGHHVGHRMGRFDVRYIKDQVYLHPHPRELMLRNHV